MAASDQEELRSDEDSTKHIGPFTLVKAKTFETGGPSSPSPQRAFREIAQRVRLKKNTYDYKPINSHKEIRILRLFRGKKNDPLECALFPIALHSTIANNRSRNSNSNSQDHPYSALSYCWGEPEDEPTKELLIYDDTNKHDLKKSYPAKKFYVRENLFAALLQFRQTNKDINLWVDAICINQEKKPDALKEKTAQVARMDEVYSQAQTVCVWLGEGTSETKETFQFLKSILDLQNYDDLIKNKRKPEKWLLLVQLMRNRWFSRRWVIQELALAREAIVHWGAEKLMWADFADAIALAMTKHQEIKDMLRTLTRSDVAKLFKSNLTIHVDIPGPRALGAHTLVNASSNLFRRSDEGHIQKRLVDLEVLVSSLFLPFEASEPRDTIYAVLSLARDTVSQNDLAKRPSWFKAAPKSLKHVIGGIISPALLWEYWFGLPAKQTSEPTDAQASIDDRIIPDYDKSLTDVWAGFIEYCIERSQSLDIICRHWAPRPRKPTWREDLERQKANIKYEEEKIPTWVPAIERHAYGGPTGILIGRTNGDSLVGSIERQNQQCYNASGGLPPCVVFGRINGGQTQKYGDSEDNETIRNSTTPALNDPPARPEKLTMGISRKFDGTLHVKGFKIDTIERITGRVLDGVIPEEGLQFGGWKRDDSGNFPDRVPERLWRTLVADRDVDGMAAPTWYRRACLECLQHTNANDDLNTKDFKDLDRTPDTMKIFLERMQAVTWCRRFFLTKGKEGRGDDHEPLYGIGPRDLAIGDMICILFGCSVPVVLRKVSTEQYIFIGECYVHGMMDGESLPSKQSLVLKHPYEEVDGFTIV
ncbi:uncharacterized protein PAC_15324 [Phialocephala subalpina]|uniref:Heterokaryon incompatibility domain-containing protein n=1 Tax=Phialocephala subalpina TaxID=576137 RepID=A0A1L7XK83_9HELO|nr:uncharacterized protein PAC_15324 [Phialocephala subalpina]